MQGVSVAKHIGRGVVVAGTIAVLSLTTAPRAAYAGGPGVGAAIGLGILGGVLAGAAVASSYDAPPPAYDYPPPGYYQPAPAYYPAQPYDGSTPYGGYAPYNYC